MPRHFASDNWAGAHPEVIEAIARASAEGHAHSYGEDPLTESVAARIRDLVGGGQVHFVFNGTAANVIGLSTLLEPWQAVICSDVAHINVDECGAFERFSGARLIPVPTTDGKLTPALIEERLTGLGDVHRSQPRALSITQATEYGTVYSVAEVRAIADCCRKHGLILQMDGARLANAAASLGAPLRDFTLGAGVDVLSFGGTKNGLIAGEAVVLADSDRACNFGFVRKQGMQLASKARFLAAQFGALLDKDLWLRSAQHANAMAQRLHQRIGKVPGVMVTQRVEANAVFAILPREAIAPLRAEFWFYVWNEATGEVRLMTSWDTTEADVDAFAGAIEREARR